eukprot:COSAG02_NODE_128_length_34833_cov_44.465221_2_plen_841_part_00
MEGSRTAAAKFALHPAWALLTHDASESLSWRRAACREPEGCAPSEIAEGGLLLLLQAHEMLAKPHGSRGVVSAYTNSTGELSAAVRGYLLVTQDPFYAECPMRTQNYGGKGGSQQLWWCGMDKGWRVTMPNANTKMGGGGALDAQIPTDDELVLLPVIDPAGTNGAEGVEAEVKQLQELLETASAPSRYFSPPGPDSSAVDTEPGCTETGTAMTDNPAWNDSNGAPQAIDRQDKVEQASLAVEESTLTGPKVGAAQVPTAPAAARASTEIHAPVLVVDTPSPTYTVDEVVPFVQEGELVMYGRLQVLSKASPRARAEEVMVKLDTPIVLRKQRLEAMAAIRRNMNSVDTIPIEAKLHSGGISWYSSQGHRRGLGSQGRANARVDGDPAAFPKRLAADQLLSAKVCAQEAHAFEIVSTETRCHLDSATVPAQQGSPEVTRRPPKVALQSAWGEETPEGRSYRFTATSNEDRDAWIAAILNVATAQPGSSQQEASRASFRSSVDQADDVVDQGTQQERQREWTFLCFWERQTFKRRRDNFCGIALLTILSTVGLYMGAVSADSDSDCGVSVEKTCTGSLNVICSTDSRCPWHSSQCVDEHYYAASAGESTTGCLDGPYALEQYELAGSTGIPNVNGHYTMMDATDGCGGVPTYVHTPTAGYAFGRRLRRLQDNQDDRHDRCVSSRPASDPDRCEQLLLYRSISGSWHVGSAERLEDCSPLRAYVSRPLKDGRSPGPPNDDEAYGAWSDTTLQAVDMNPPGSFNAAGGGFLLFIAVLFWSIWLLLYLLGYNPKNERATQKFHGQYRGSEDGVRNAEALQFLHKSEERAVDFARPRTTPYRHVT